MNKATTGSLVSLASLESDKNGAGHEGQARVYLGAFCTVSMFWLGADTRSFPRQCMDPESELVDLAPEVGVTAPPSLTEELRLFFLATPPHQLIYEWNRAHPNEMLSRVGEGSQGEVYAGVGGAIKFGMLGSEVELHLRLDGLPGVLCVLASKTYLGIPYLLLEQAQHSLRDVIENGLLDAFEDRLRFAIEATDALGRVHAAGILHRDVKPGNLLLVADAEGVFRVKLADFGISIPANDAAATFQVSRGRKPPGTPGFLAPELLARKQAPFTQASDVFSLALTINELLGGKKASSVPEMELVTGERPEMRADLPWRIQLALRSAWSTEPADRPTALELSDMLTNSDWLAVRLSRSGLPEEVVARATAMEEKELMDAVLERQYNGERLRPHGFSDEHADRLHQLLHPLARDSATSDFLKIVGEMLPTLQAAGVTSAVQLWELLLDPTFPLQESHGQQLWLLLARLTWQRWSIGYRPPPRKLNPPTIALQEDASAEKEWVERMTLAAVDVARGMMTTTLWGRVRHEHLVLVVEGDELLSKGDVRSMLALTGNFASGLEALLSRLVEAFGEGTTAELTDGRLKLKLHETVSERWRRGLRARLKITNPTLALHGFKMLRKTFERARLPKLARILSEALQQATRGEQMDTDGAQLMWALKHARRLDAVYNLEGNYSFLRSVPFHVGVATHFLSYAVKTENMADWSVLQLAQLITGCNVWLNTDSMMEKALVILTVLDELDRVRVDANVDWCSAFDALTHLARVAGDVEQMAFIEQQREEMVRYLPTKTLLQEACQQATSAKRLTEQQAGNFLELLSFGPGEHRLVGAAAGCGKRLLLAKAAAEVLRSAQYASERLLLVTSGCAQMWTLVSALGAELGDISESLLMPSADVQTMTLSSAAMNMAGGFVCLSTVDAALRGEAVVEGGFTRLLVDEGQHVFAHQPDVELEGQHELFNATAVWPRLSRLLNGEAARVAVLYDQCQARTRSALPSTFQPWSGTCLTTAVRLTGAVHGVSSRFGIGAQSLHPDALTGRPVQFVDVTGTTLSMESDDYTQRLSELNRAQMESEESEWVESYATAIASCLSLMWREALATDGVELKSHMLAVVVPGSCGRAWWRNTQVRTAAKLMEVWPSLGKMVSGAVDTWTLDLAQKMWWGPAENFAGLDRPVVCVAGFHAPRARLARASEVSTGSLTDWRAYIAMTRCTWALYVAEPSASTWASASIEERREGR